MTVAVCWKCGAMKSGAFKPCPKCGATPTLRDDQVISLAMSDHFSDKSTMEAMAADVAAGKPLELDPEVRLFLITILEAARARGLEDQPLPPPPTKKPWWRKMF